MNIKEQVSEIVINQAFREHDPKKCAVACSFGKDSLVVLNLVRKKYPDIWVVFCNTGVEYPETLAFRDEMLSKGDLNYLEVIPPTDFWEISKKYGLPNIRLDAGTRVPKCCLLLKDKPAMEAYEFLGSELVFTGLTSAESHSRTMFFKRCGEYYFAKTQNLWKCHPIMSWTEEDVWSYIRENHLSYNSFYDKHPGHRVGCMPCTSYRSWMKRMAEATPGMYRKIQKMRGQELID
jgi:phosphoadenosine phosphosulfate reductase